MKSFLFSILFFCLSTHSQAQLYVENKYNVSFYVAIAYFQSGTTFTGWISKGWTELKPGETKELLHVNPTGKKIYLYAHSELKTIEGNQPFLTSSDSEFRIKGADLKETGSENPSYQWHSFYEIKRGFSRNFKNKETIQLVP